MCASFRAFLLRHWFLDWSKLFSRSWELSKFQIACLAVYQLCVHIVVWKQDQRTLCLATFGWQCLYCYIIIHYIFKYMYILICVYLNICIYILIFLFAYAPRFTSEFKKKKIIFFYHYFSHRAQYLPIIWLPFWLSTRHSRQGSYQCMVVWGMSN